ncbi:hypothetical protein H5410_053636, partial [Solanum commersonii]
VPTIDFCKIELKPGTIQWDSTKSQVFQALQEYGCFEAIYDKLRNETLEAMFGRSKEIFEFPLEIKMKKLVKEITLQWLHREATNITIVCIDLTLATFNVVKSYTKPLVELDEMVKRMVLESLGLQNYIDQFLDLTSFLLRLTKYKAAQDEDIGNKPGICDYTDGNFLTIISQNQVNGLQILKKNGEWIDADISSNSFIVLAGDSFMAWTNG